MQGGVALTKIIYVGNVSDGRQVPLDSNAYTPGANVNVAINDASQAPHQQKDSGGNSEKIVTGNLSRAGATFLYWNTAADGTGTSHGGFADNNFAFPNQSGNLTLYAQWAVSTGLTNGGFTAHYTFRYDESLGGTSGVESARTNGIIAQCE